MSKFDKDRCLFCMYHGTNSGGITFCDYLGKTGETCLKRGKKGTLTDIRGDDPKNCALYEKGSPTSFLITTISAGTAERPR